MIMTVLLRYHIIIEETCSHKLLYSIDSATEIIFLVIMFLLVMVSILFFISGLS